MKLVPEVGLERRQAIDNTQVIDFINATIATISWFGGKLVRIEYTARVNFRISTLHTAALRRFADFSSKWASFLQADFLGACQNVTLSELLTILAQSKQPMPNESIAKQFADILLNYYVRS